MQWESAMTKWYDQGEGLNDKNTNLKTVLKGIHKKWFWNSLPLVKCMLLANHAKILCTLVCQL